MTVRHITIERSHDGQRIDNFLLTHLKGVPRSLIYRLLRTGQVRVNRGRIKPVYRLRQGDVVRIPPVLTSEAREVRVPDALCASLQERILYEDHELIILNKPAGLAVHGGQNLRFGVIEAMRQLRGDGVELVHRLDRATSGCLILVKERQRLKALHELFGGRRMSKRYLALVRGCWQEGERRVELALTRGRESSGKRQVQVDDDGKTSSSTFTPLQCFAGCSLMRIAISTGRMHQIRVHAAHLGHPVAGDEKYGDFAFNREMRGVGLKRMFLHAEELDFVVPWSGQHILVQAPLDRELQAVLTRLQDGGDRR